MLSSGIRCFDAVGGAPEEISQRACVDTATPLGTTVLPQPGVDLSDLPLWTAHTLLHRELGQQRQRYLAQFGFVHQRPAVGMEPVLVDHVQRG